MKKFLLLTTVLLVGAGGVGAALAASDAFEHRFGSEHRRVGVGASEEGRGVVRLADRDRDRERDRDDRRRHHEDDEDDEDDDDGARGARMPVTGPTDPAAPVPDNGLFKDKARPKVEVQ